MQAISAAAGHQTVIEQPTAPDAVAEEEARFAHITRECAHGHAIDEVGGVAVGERT